MIGSYDSSFQTWENSAEELLMPSDKSCDIDNSNEERPVENYDKEFLSDDEGYAIPSESDQPPTFHSHDVNLFESASAFDERGVDFDEIEVLHSTLKLMKEEEVQTAKILSEKYKNFDFDKRFTFYTEKTDLIQAETFMELLDGKDSVTSVMKDSPFWIDVSCPNSTDMKIISKIFNIHPLSLEDIQLLDTREKCEVFDRYTFICCNLDAEGENKNFYLVIFSNYILSIHHHHEKAIRSIIKRLNHLQSFIDITTDWMTYAILDEIIDHYMPHVSTMEVEAETIGDLTLMLSENEKSDLLVRIGTARQKLNMQQRLLRPKLDILRTLLKKCKNRISSHCILYLRDIQDHIIQMLQSLEHYNETLSRSHANYLAQISIELTQASNKMNILMKKFSAAASILLPLQLVSGIWGMNINVPGAPNVTIKDCVFFYIMCLAMSSSVVIMWILGRRFHWFD